MSLEQRENLDAILRQNAFPFDSDVSEQRRLLREFASARPLPPGVTVTAAELGGVPTAEITIDGIDPRHVVLYFHGGGLPTTRRDKTPLLASSAPSSPTCPACRR